MEPPHWGQASGRGASRTPSTAVGSGGKRWPWRPWAGPDLRPGRLGWGLGGPLENGAAWRLDWRCAWSRMARASSSSRRRRSCSWRSCSTWARSCCNSSRTEKGTDTGSNTLIDAIAASSLHIRLDSTLRVPDGKGKGALIKYLPKQDADLPRRLEAGIERGGQMLKRRLLQYAVEQADAELLLAQRHGKQGRGILCRGTTPFTFKTVFGTV